ncbi:MAG: hypothetical protein GY906_20040 [bacterium]|nr:hypothetical protein [bacterium]
MDLIKQVQVLETALQRLILDWERFFSGDIRVPPHADRDRLQQRLRHLGEHPSTRRAEQFRLEQLQNRFMTYYQLWERQLKEREEGRLASGRMRRGAPAPMPSPNEALSRSVGDNGGESLFERYVSARQQAGDQVKLDQASFDRQIERQRQEIESKLGRKVQFEVVVEGKRVKLAARAKNGKGRES